MKPRKIKRPYLIALILMFFGNMLAIVTFMYLYPEADVLIVMSVVSGFSVTITSTLLGLVQTEETLIRQTEAKIEAEETKRVQAEELKQVHDLVNSVSVELNKRIQRQAHAEGVLVGIDLEQVRNSTLAEINRIILEHDQWERQRYEKNDIDIDIINKRLASLEINPKGIR